jgi:hypothetical protein
MAYTAAFPNAYDTNLIPVEVRAQYFEEVLLQSPLSMFMGSTPESVIQVVYKKNGTGNTTTFSFSRELDYKSEIFDYDQITGKGQDLKFYEDTITVRQRTGTDKIQGIQLVQLNTPIDIYNALKPKLLTRHKRNITYSLLKSATFDNYGPAYTAGPVTDRIQYGTNTAYDANMITAAGNIPAMNFAAAGYPDATGGLTVAGIKKLRDMAVQGGQSFESNKRISPFMLKTREGFPYPMYVYFMSTESYKSLEADPDWKGFYNRGIIEMPNQPSSLVGSFFRGQIDGVLIYEVPELSNFKLGNAQGFGGGGALTATFAWNLFCGAQAFGLVWHKEPWFEQEFSNMRTIVQMAMLEFRGEKAIKFPSFQNEAISIENGIIHHIVRLTNAS